MKDSILEILNNSNKALTVEEIDDRLNIKSIEETKKFLSLLNELEEEGEIYHSNKNKYMIFNNGPLKKGVIRMNKKGFGFVEVEGSEDIFISIDNINNALHNDVVVVEVLSRKEDGRLEGRILRTIKRDLSTVVGEILYKGNECTVVPDDNKLKVELIVKTEGENLGLVDGHKVVVRIDKLIQKGKYLCSLEKIIGHKNDPGVDILSIVYNYEIKDTFDEETIAELDNIPEEVLESEKKGRRDLTNEVIFTIDGDDTKDIDDAISIEKLDNGHYKLGVHIADVSYYVKEGSAIDNEAMMRGTSVYLVDRVIPMLPHKLSNGICSLNPNVERLAMSCVMEIDEKGKTVDYEIFESLIKSKIQMTYKKVNQVIEEDIIPEGYEPYADKLKLMNELSLIVRKEKNNRGYIDFDVKEAKILVDERCHPTDIILRNRGRGENDGLEDEKKDKATENPEIEKENNEEKEVEGKKEKKKDKEEIKNTRKRRLIFLVALFTLFFTSFAVTAVVIINAKNLVFVSDEDKKTVKSLSEKIEELKNIIEEKDAEIEQLIIEGTNGGAPSFSAPVSNQKPQTSNKTTTKTQTSNKTTSKTSKTDTNKKDDAVKDDETASSEGEEIFDEPMISDEDNNTKNDAEEDEKSDIKDDNSTSEDEEF